MSLLDAEIYRRPRNRLLLNGVPVGTCEALEISSSNRAQAASFFARICLTSSAATAGRLWLSSDSLEASLQLGFLPSGMSEGFVEWQEMLTGVVDHVRYDPVSGNVDLEGRDFASRLLDLPITEAFLNTTSSDVAQQLAARCSLSCVYDSSSTMIGQYYQIEHSRQSLVRFSRFGTAWDLLCSLAQFEGFDVWVEGKTLYFVSADRDPVNSVDIALDISGGPNRVQLNVSSLVVERRLAVPPSPTIQVSSWNSRQRLRVTAQAGSQEPNGPTPINVLRPNLLQDTAQKLASGVLGQVARHRQTLNVTMPGDLTLMPRDRLIVSGMGSTWDGNYRIDSLDREMTLGGGFTQSLTAKMEIG